MGMYRYIRELHRSPKKNLGDVFKERLLKLRRSPVTVRLDKPTRLDRARSLGYRAKQGIFVVRQRVIRGGRQRERFSQGRRSKARSRVKIVNKSYQTVAEERVQKKYPNCEILNSYNLIDDGRHSWYEVIVVDKDHPAIIKDKSLGFLASPKQTRRVYRGLTSSARKTRGLNRKGKGAEKVRPSLKAQKGRLH